MSDITRILSAIQHGDATASEQLLPLVYQELRKLAAAKLSFEQPGQTIQPTVLVHEAYLRLVNVEEPQRWDGMGHFFTAAAEAMRRILIENARRKQTERRGGGQKRLDLDTVNPESKVRDDELLALDESLAQLERRWPERGQLVKLRYFAGMTIPEAAKTLRISRATAERHWTFARAWLRAQLQHDGAADQNRSP